MIERETLTEQLKQSFLDTYLRIAELDKVLIHSPGTLIWKGKEKKYSYWQYYVKGKQFQHYVRPAELAAVQNEIRVMKEQKRRQSALRTFLSSIKRALRAFKIQWQEILAAHEQQLAEKKKQQTLHQRAKNIAAKKKYTHQYKHATDRGDLVASKSEEIIANLLFSRGIRYEYEKPITIGSWHLKPDFTVWRKDGSMLIWEHAGLVDDEKYARKFQQKLEVYKSAGFTPTKNLIVTEDENGAFSAEEARRMIYLYKLD